MSSRRLLPCAAEPRLCSESLGSLILFVCAMSCHHRILFWSIDRNSLSPSTIPRPLTPLTVNYSPSPHSSHRQLSPVPSLPPLQSVIEWLKLVKPNATRILEHQRKYEARRKAREPKPAAQPPRASASASARPDFSVRLPNAHPNAHHSCILSCSIERRGVHRRAEASE